MYKKYRKYKYFTSRTEESKIRRVIREDKYALEWRNVSYYGKLSEKFIREFQDKIDWNEICSMQELSENFIREFRDKMNWHTISYRFILSEPFLREFKNEVDWSLVKRNAKMYFRKFSTQFLEDMKEYLEKY